ncbi:hypothetical protein BJ508DRAFT_130023 [Ascobolus immersus RN42]|uniref:Prion-inhibition and propagation HeLo domain-containing protein n=1 Tax=Ascobolus immersus RN42 TaxID=1160509 RepID=A0A3N4I505_ASCIM|nr:hypothetical protein BJ508DRAFT_130023 [Ascobolus immersus RN42]
MADTVSFAIGLVGLASIFTSCVDAFNLFKSAQNFPNSIQILLVKLDIEKTRLLAWGEKTGIFEENIHHHSLDNADSLQLFERILKSVQMLLTDAQALRSQYGVQSEESTQKLSSPPAALLSSGSMQLLKRSRERFFIRNASRLLGSLGSQSEVGMGRRTLWAIHDERRFEGLLVHLRELIDGLYELPELLRIKEASDIAMVTEIALIPDISTLRLVEEASEASYPLLSKAASDAIEASEHGTVNDRKTEDQRNMAERLRELDGDTGAASSPDTLSAELLETLFYEVQGASSVNFITARDHSCQMLRSEDPCDTQRIFDQIDKESTGLFRPKYARCIASRYEKNGTSLWQLIDKIVNIGKKLQESIQIPSDESSILGLLSKDSDSLSPQQNQALSALLPLLKVYIYCPPCTCLLQTALWICGKLEEKRGALFQIQVRPDDRIVSSCCASVSDRTSALSGIWAAFQKKQSSADEYNSYSRPLIDLDRLWLEQRVNHFEYEEPYDYRVYRDSDQESHCFVLGETQHLAPWLQSILNVKGRRIPKEGEIWKMTPSGWNTEKQKQFQFSFAHFHITSPPVSSSSAKDTSGRPQTTVNIVTKRVIENSSLSNDSATTESSQDSDGSNVPSRAESGIKRTYESDSHPGSPNFKRAKDS